MDLSSKLNVKKMLTTISIVIIHSRESHWSSWEEKNEKKYEIFITFPSSSTSWSTFNNNNNKSLKEKDEKLMIVLENVGEASSDFYPMYGDFFLSMSHLLAPKALFKLWNIEFIWGKFQSDFSKIFLGGGDGMNLSDEWMR